MITAGISGRLMETSSRLTSILILLVCFCSTAVYASSSSGGSTYTVPICDNVNGFYCPIDGTCLHRAKRCTGDDSTSRCEQKTYQHCNYDSVTNKFKVYRYSTNLRSSRRNIVEHRFITYRGLMYEFGDYGTRVQDPNDPNYEYNTRVARDRKDLGVSNCTYEEALQFLITWNKNYNVLGNNCQHFAKGLGTYLTGNCRYPRKRNLRSDDDSDLAEYIFSIAEDGNCTSSSAGSWSASAVPLHLMFYAVIAVGIPTAAVM